MNFHIFQQTRAKFNVIPMNSLNISLNLCKDFTVEYSNYVVWFYWESVSVNVFMSVFEYKL